MAVKEDVMQKGLGATFSPRNGPRESDDRHAIRKRSRSRSPKRSRDRSRSGERGMDGASRGYRARPSETNRSPVKELTERRVDRKEQSDHSLNVGPNNADHRDEFVRSEPERRTASDEVEAAKRRFLERKKGMGPQP